MNLKTKAGTTEYQQGVLKFSKREVDRMNSPIREIEIVNYKNAVGDRIDRRYLKKNSMHSRDMQKENTRRMTEWMKQPMKED